MTVLVTGAAGFIGYHLAKRLTERGLAVIGLDNLNDYYDVHLKKARLAQMEGSALFQFVRGDVTDASLLDELMERHRPDSVVHLAAQAGVRASHASPESYIQSNLVGFAAILEACRKRGVSHLVYASSSSVYGANKKQPFSVEDRTDHPISLYAATKKSGELLAHAYSHMYGIPTTGLRFFTVYGPWGRPDMAYYSFTRRILAGEPIAVYNYGRMKRDFTYVDDIVRGIELVLERPPERSAESGAPYRLLNIGNSQPVELLAFIGHLERLLGRSAVLEYAPLQAGDVVETYADVEALRLLAGFEPDTPLEQGLEAFTRWYLDYYSGNTV